MSWSKESLSLEQEDGMKFTPLHDWILIRPSEAEEVSRGGLYIPDAAKQKPHQGTVEAAGPGALEEEKKKQKAGEKKERRFIPTVVKPGDLVMYERYAAQTYTIGGNERVLVRERDILGVLTGQQARPKPLLLPAATSVPGSTALVTKVFASPLVLAEPGEDVSQKPAKKKAGKRKPARKKSAVKAKTKTKKTVKKTTPKKKSVSTKRTTSQKVKSTKTSARKTAAKAKKKK